MSLTMRLLNLCLNWYDRNFRTIARLVIVLMINRSFDRYLPALRLVTTDGQHKYAISRCHSILLYRIIGHLSM